MNYIIQNYSVDGMNAIQVLENKQLSEEKRGLYLTKIGLEYRLDNIKEAINVQKTVISLISEDNKEYKAVQEQILQNLEGQGRSTENQIKTVDEKLQSN
jgi:hypothetical protein